jgi:hypothetical protein
VVACAHAASDGSDAVTEAQFTATVAPQ